MVSAASPAITILRPPPTGPWPPPLTRSQIAADPVASEALRWTEAYDGWLRLHGIDGWDGQGGDITVMLQRTPFTTSISSADGRMSLSYEPDVARFHLARSPEVVGHELSHGLIDRHAKLDWTVDEAVSDVLGALFARSAGHPPALRDWALADELQFHDTTDGSPGLRDLAHPRFVDVASLRAALGDTTTLAPELVHHAAGPVRLAATRMADELGLADASRLWLDAITKSLPAITGGSAHEEFLEKVEQIKRDGTFEGADEEPAPSVDRIIRSMGDVATATLDTAGSLWGEDSPRTRAVRDAWSSVGVMPAAH